MFLQRVSKEEFLLLVLEEINEISHSTGCGFKNGASIAFLKADHSTPAGMQSKRKES